MVLSRRAFLSAGLGGGLAALAGCRGSSAARPPRSSSAAPTSAAPSTTAPTATPAPDWAALGDRLQGRLVRPGEPGYAAGRRLFNPRFDGARPRAIAYCRTADDVRATVDFARDGGLPLALRSGGHSYGGWSTGSGVLLDVSAMNDVSVRAGTATVGAGARLIDVYAGLAAGGRAIAAGSCPSVGVTGLALGGGVGVLTRAWGLTCDQLSAVDLVTADGRLRRADATQQPDLFWALRGGGGAQVGAVTALHFRTHAAAPVTVFYLRWPWSEARSVLAAWRSWSEQSPRRLWSTCKLLTQPGQADPRVFVAGTWLGSPAGLARQLDDLAAAVGHAPAARTATTYDYLAAMQREAGCPDAPAARCSTPRTAYDSASNVLLTPLPDRAAEVAVAGVDRRQRMHRDHEDGVSFDALGGAVRDLAAGATAFPYRQATALAQYNVTWTPGTARATVERDRSWLHGLRADLTEVLGDHAYVNYADPTLDDFGTAYYGANRARLAAVREVYDPDGVFAFPQSVPA